MALYIAQPAQQPPKQPTPKHTQTTIPAIDAIIMAPIIAAHSPKRSSLKDALQYVVSLSVDYVLNCYWNQGLNILI